ncbi:MAG: metalloregulator ArsR/SmtB family transcription factor [Candidatus Bathyarchaeia archaeon]|nr:winged helix-turn-helix transcriptional regulator [Candidatus Bathyarchaeota archaeon]
MKDFAIDEQLKRLVESGLLDIKDLDEYKERLRELKDDVFSIKEKVRNVSRVFKALSHPTRIKILSLLNIYDLCVCEIVMILNISQSNISHHLNILENAGLIEKRRKGKWTFYSVSRSEVMKNIQLLIKII